MLFVASSCSSALRAMNLEVGPCTSRSEIVNPNLMRCCLQGAILTKGLSTAELCTTCWCLQESGGVDSSATSGYRVQGLGFLYNPYIDSSGLLLRNID